jgi:hypothetical protein
MAVSDIVDSLRQTESVHHDPRLSPDQFYQGECQEKELPGGRIFSRFPARVIEQDCASLSVP